MVVVGDGGGTVTIEAVPGASVHIAVPEGQGGAGMRIRAAGPVDEAKRREMVERARATYLFRMLSDPDIRSELGLSAEQETRIAALVEKEGRERERIKDDVRMQFGGDNAGTDPEAHEREMVRQTGQAMRDAQPRFDRIAKEATDTLTDEQKTRLDQVVRERYRLMAACGDLWVLVTAGAKESLGLDDAQAAGIRKVLVEAADRLDAQRKVAFESAKDVPTEQRGEAMRAMWEGFRKARDESIAASRQRVFALLTDAQKPKAEKFLAETKTSARHLWGGATVQPFNVGRAERARPAARWSAVPAVYEGGARFVPAAKRAGQADRGRPPDRPRTRATLRMLDEPAVRAELNLTAEQEKRIFVIQEKARRLLDRIRAEAREQLGDRPRKNPDDVDRRELKRRAAEASEEAMRAAAPELDALAKEAADVLTADQRAKLDELGRDRAHFLRATGGLAALLLPGPRRRVGITDPQAERIRAILEETAKAAKTLNEGPAGGTPDGRKRRQADLVREARDRIMQALEPDQRDKAHQFLTEMEGARAGQPKRRGPPEAESATKGYGQAI
ncbi:MAG TPA: Spy/CpxP family protein refolding chaperone [Phycisphaerae bacterium]|nr:Spy/CpxP family protein refolding chaperone [Phycisphaerae bacterium]